MSSSETSEKEPGYILEADDKKGLRIQTKDKIISVIEIQGEGSKRMNIKDYLRGNRLEVGTILR